MASTRKAIPKSEAIKLWTRAYGICSFPDCGRELVWGDQTPRLRGHMAHIVASSPTWTRGDPEAAPENLNRYGNLILLCPNDHEDVDAPDSEYSVDDLLEMKAEHEQRIREQLSKGDLWQTELSTVDYLNVPRILLDPAAREAIDVGTFPVDLDTETLRGMGIGLVGVMVPFEKVFTSWRAQALPLDAIGELGAEAVGARVYFEETFRTKGMTGTDKQRPGFELTGDLERDPHVYVKKDDRKIVFPLDPRWVTTSTAFSDFTSGTIKLAGVGFLKDVGHARAIISPLVLGRPPLSDEMKAFWEGLGGQRATRDTPPSEDPL